LLGRLLNARGDMGWDVPVVGHPALMAPQLRDLLNKPEYWNKTYAAGYRSTSYDASGNLPPETKELMEKIRPQLGGKEIDFLFWWVAMGYDTVKVIEHAIKTANGTDPAKIQKALEETSNFEGVYSTYSWSPKQRNGFPDKNMAVNVASTFKEGSFKLAPQ
jgi:branched-chain amino acid transport system substrate-binding protein